MSAMNETNEPLAQLQRQYDRVRGPLAQIGLISQGSVQVRIPTDFGHHSDSKRTVFRSKPDTVPIDVGQCSGRKRTDLGRHRNGVRVVSE
jgi:hypothetical protein